MTDPTARNQTTNLRPDDQVDPKQPLFVGDKVKKEVEATTRYYKVTKATLVDHEWTFKLVDWETGLDSHIGLTFKTDELRLVTRAAQKSAGSNK
ncbi:hypothetical protein PRZ48_002111 [Zasmidium cellare]|uniref:Uncharacterized protein n=1 Tax=Zasmidium cellare TaxID=395010 RepID=A0ABR0F5V3_ZASCE|nr:hypothetical protein PRZ48_002111 [Zasmidium cellare]